MRTVVTTEELRIDLLSRQLMTSAYDGNVEALLAANPGLSEQGAFIAAGTRLIVPEPLPPATISAPNPWE